MKRWHAILLGLGITMVVGGLIAVGALRVIPQYAPGEATAMVQRAYDLPGFSEFAEETYLGRGVWDVRLVSNDGYIIFKVYETTGTVEIYDTSFPQLKINP